MKAYWILFTALFSTLTFAQDISFKSKRSSPFKLVDNSQSVTRFSGRAILKGTFIASLDISEEQYPKNIRLLFFPDLATQAILPHESFYGPVREIRIFNEEEALIALVPPSQLKDFSAGRTRQLSGNSQIMVSSYTTNVDCDIREYSASFLSVVTQPNKILAAKSPRIETGC
jgi:hypothetical protein